MEERWCVVEARAWGDVARGPRGVDRRPSFVNRCPTAARASVLVGPWDPPDHSCANSMFCQGTRGECGGLCGAGCGVESQMPVRVVIQITIATSPAAHLTPHATAARRIHVASPSASPSPGHGTPAARPRTSSKTPTSQKYTHNAHKVITDMARLALRAPRRSARAMSRHAPP